MSTNKYPEEIYIYPKGSHPKLFGKVAKDMTARVVAEYAYDLGKKHREVPESATWILEALERGNLNHATAIGQAVALGKERAQDDADDWHNLTVAIAEGQPIDWERLERRKVKIAHPEEVEIFGYLKSDLDLRRAGKLHMPLAWTLGESLNGWTNRFLHEALSGLYGWELYVKGEIPINRKTADELEHGTVFKASLIDGTILAILAEHEDGKNVLGLEHVFNLDAGNVVVHEVIGNIRDLVKKESK